MKKKYAIIGLIGFIVGLGGLALSRTGDQKEQRIIVYQSKTCSCCKKWVKHLESNNFTVTSEYVADVTDVKLKYGLPMKLASCHTAIIDGYLIEGHVPADSITKLLKERPAVLGIAVPGMPIGSPGMEGSYVEPYQVIAFDAKGSESVFGVYK